MAVRAGEQVVAGIVEPEAVAQELGAPPGMHLGGGGEAGSAVFLPVQENIGAVEAEDAVAVPGWCGAVFIFQSAVFQILQPGAPPS
jgi:hypothetical protein